MTVKEILGEALGLLGRNDAAEYLSSDKLPEGEIKELITTLIYCFNAVEDELARNYFPVKNEEIIRAKNGSFYFSSLAFQPVKILCVKVDGEDKQFKLFPQYFTVDGASIATVEYEYTPNKRDILGESVYGGAEVGARLIAYGTISEYCLINGEISFAEMWESRYRKEIDLARQKYLPSARIAPRRWV